MEKGTECAATLDSNLQKAEELEAGLRGWKQRLHFVSSSAFATFDAGEGLSVAAMPGLPESDAVLNGGRTGSTAMGGGKGEEVRAEILQGAWHKLTLYILELEKRVREMEEAGAAGRASATVAHSTPPSQTAVGSTTSAHAGGEVGERGRENQMATYEQALLLVFSWLSTAELCTASQVCCRWRGVALSPQLWLTVSIRDTVITSQDLVNLGRLCSLTHSISLHGLMPEMAGPDEELTSYIARQRGSLEPGLGALLSCAPQLISLSVTECNLMLTERLLWLASVHCPQLRQFTYTSDEFPPTAAALWTLSNGCPSLQSLHLPPYPTSPFISHFNDFCLSTVAKGWPRLLQLTVGGAGITAAGLKEIVSYCPWLELLRVEFGPQLSSSDVAAMVSGGGLSHLRSLSLSFTPISPKAIFKLSTACPILTILTLHISPNTYFPGSSADTAVLQKYHQIHSNFQELQKLPEMKGVFCLHHHPPTTNTGL